MNYKLIYQNAFPMSSCCVFGTELCHSGINEVTELSMQQLNH